MMKKIFPTAAALLLGAVGAILRKYQLDTVFTEANGLARKNAPVSILLAVLSITAILFAVLYSLRYRKVKHNGVPYKKAFYNDNRLALALGLAAGALFSVFAFMTAFTGKNIVPGIGGAVFAILSVATGISMAVLAAESYTQKHGNDVTMLVSVVPTLTFCFWMAAEYMINADEPVLISYCYDCIAFASASLCFYYASGYAYGRSNPARTSAAHLAAVFFLTLILGNDRDILYRSMIGCADLFVILNSVSFFNSILYNEKPRENDNVQPEE